MALNFVPKPWQKPIIDSIKANERIMIMADMGTGKTSATLTAMESIDRWPVVIVAPLLVAEGTWVDEVSKWAHTQNRKVVSLCGGKKKFEKGIKIKADIYTINYENVSFLIGYKMAMLVIDESTRLKGFRARQGTKRARHLYKIALGVDRLVLLTGTPIPKGFKDIWGQIVFIDRGYRLGTSYGKFVSKFFTEVRCGNSEHATKLQILEGSQEEIERRIADITLTIRAKDWFDIELPIERELRFNLPSKVRGQYNTMEKKLFMDIEEGQILAQNAAVKMMKLAQITAGAVYTEDGYEVLHDQKLIMLESVIAEFNETPIVVSYHFKSDKKRILSHFKNAVALGKDPSVVRDFNEGKIPILLVHPASAGHGINLAVGSNVIVFFTCNLRTEEHQQVIERLGPMRQKQANMNRHCYVYRIIANDSIDEDIVECLKNETDFQNVFQDRMSHKTKGDICTS